MEPCEEALEFALPEFSQYLSGNPAIQDNALFVNGHLLDKIDTKYAIKDEKNVFELVIKVEVGLKQRDKSMFGAYYSDFQTLAGRTMSSTPTASDRLREENNSEASQLLPRFQNVPPVLADIIRHTAVEACHPLESRQLNIEALWSTLTAVFNRRRKMPKPLGYHMLIEDHFFVTKKGIFGRAPAEAVKQGQVVTILGGAYVPYLLEKRESHYKLISHSYVERIMSIESCPTDWKVGRIENR